LGKWSSGNWYSNDSYKQVNDYKYYGNQKVYSKTVKTDATTTKWPLNEDTKQSYDYRNYTTDDAWDCDWLEDENEIDEWEMYEVLCDIYGLDPNDDKALAELETYMTINGCDSLSDLYNYVIE